jgi:hypothetical protein
LSYLLLHVGRCEIEWLGCRALPAPRPPPADRRLR